MYFLGFLFYFHILMTSTLPITRETTKSSLDVFDAMELQNLGINSYTEVPCIPYFEMKLPRRLQSKYNEYFQKFGTQEQKKTKEEHTEKLSKLDLKKTVSNRADLIDQIKDEKEYIEKKTKEKEENEKDNKRGKLNLSDGTVPDNPEALDKLDDKERQKQKDDDEKMKEESERKKEKFREKLKRTYIVKDKDGLGLYKYYAKELKCFKEIHTGLEQTIEAERAGTITSKFDQGTDIKKKSSKLSDLYFTIDMYKNQMRRICYSRAKAFCRLNYYLNDDEELKKLLRIDDKDDLGKKRAKYMKMRGYELNDDGNWTFNNDVFEKYFKKGFDICFEDRHCMDRAFTLSDIKKDADAITFEITKFIDAPRKYLDDLNQKQYQLAQKRIEQRAEQLENEAKAEEDRAKETQNKIEKLESKDDLSPSQKRQLNKLKDEKYKSQMNATDKRLKKENLKYQAQKAGIKSKKKGKVSNKDKADIKVQSELRKRDVYNKMKDDAKDYQRGITKIVGNRRASPRYNLKSKKIKNSNYRLNKSAQRINTAINKALPKSKKLRRAKEKYDKNIKNLENRRDQARTQQEREIISNQIQSQINRRDKVVAMQGVKKQNAKSDTDAKINAAANLRRGILPTTGKKQAADAIKAKAQELRRKKEAQIQKEKQEKLKQERAEQKRKEQQIQKEKQEKKEQAQKDKERQIKRAEQRKKKAEEREKKEAERKEKEKKDAIELAKATELAKLKVKQKFNEQQQAKNAPPKPPPPPPLPPQPKPKLQPTNQGTFVKALNKKKEQIFNKKQATAPTKTEASAANNTGPPPSKAAPAAPPTAQKPQGPSANNTGTTAAQPAAPPNTGASVAAAVKPTTNTASQSGPQASAKPPVAVKPTTAPPAPQQNKQSQGVKRQGFTREGHIKRNRMKEDLEKLKKLKNEQFNKTIEFPEAQRRGNSAYSEANNNFMKTAHKYDELKEKLAHFEQYQS